MNRAEQHRRRREKMGFDESVCIVDTGEERKEEEMLRGDWRYVNEAESHQLPDISDANATD